MDLGDGAGDLVGGGELALHHAVVAGGRAVELLPRD